ncbi:hypothetical protein C8R46DRAFT_383293 [Mycena filopes]|nr:hypothetical protein C8R46DRAFT_383293 [Mycena filopes]
MDRGAPTSGTPNSRVHGSPPRWRRLHCSRATQTTKASQTRRDHGEAAQRISRPGPVSALQPLDPGPPSPLRRLRRPPCSDCFDLMEAWEVVQGGLVKDGTVKDTLPVRASCRDQQGCGSFRFVGRGRQSGADSVHRRIREVADRRGSGLCL